VLGLQALERRRAACDAEAERLVRVLHPVSSSALPPTLSSQRSPARALKNARKRLVQRRPARAELVRERKAPHRLGPRDERGVRRPQPHVPRVLGVAAAQRARRLLEQRHERRVPRGVRLHRPIDVRRVRPERVGVRGGERAGDRGPEARVLRVASAPASAVARRPDASGRMFSFAASRNVPSTMGASAMLDTDRAGANRRDQTRRYWAIQRPCYRIVQRESSASSSDTGRTS
jgi:hypothetical protein